MHATDSVDRMAHNAPRTTTVLVFLAAFAITMSYLGVYAVTNTLVASNMLPAFTPGADPRPQWMLNTFLVSFAVCAVFGTFFRWLSVRQLRRIDAMADAEDMRR